jgi:phosphopantetheinyl transferase (holo-ACP synthase)
MSPRPFPFPLRVGTDLCSVPRLRSLITKAQNGNKGPPLNAFLHKILTHPERSYFRERFGNNEAVFRNVDNVAQFLAGRYVSQTSCVDEIGLALITDLQVRSQRSMSQGLRSPGDIYTGLQAYYGTPRHYA